MEARDEGCSRSASCPELEFNDTHEIVLLIHVELESCEGGLREGERNERVSAVGLL